MSALSAQRPLEPVSIVLSLWISESAPASGRTSTSSTKQRLNITLSPSAAGGVCIQLRRKCCELWPKSKLDEKAEQEPNSFSANSFHASPHWYGAEPRAWLFDVAPRVVTTKGQTIPLWTLPAPGVQGAPTASISLHCERHLSSTNFPLPLLLFRASRKFPPPLGLVIHQRRVPQS